MENGPLIKKIERTLGPAAESMGYELVRVLLIGAGSGKPTLQIMAENAEGKMGVEDCEKLSKAASAILDVENVLDGAYYLEISSPGIDRPLTRLKDFDRYTGFEVRIELDTAVDGQKKFKGKLIGAVKDGIITLQAEDGLTQHRIPFDQIQKAKLILTDDLVKSAQRKKG